MQGGHPGTPSLQRLARHHRGGGGSDAGPPASPQAWSPSRHAPFRPVPTSLLSRDLGL